MLITPPDLAWVAHIRGLWAFVSGCLVASAPTPPSRVRPYRCRTPSLPGDRTDGSVGPLCGRSWPWPGAWPASTAPTLQFLYWGQARSRNLSPAGSRTSEGAACAGVNPASCASRRARVVPGQRHIWRKYRHSRPSQHGRITSIMAEAGVARQCPGGVCATGSRCSSRPTRPAMAAAVRPLGRGRAPARTPQPHHAPEATRLWPRRQPSLSG
jgi:hypothetical protein